MDDLELMLIAAADDNDQEPAFTAALLESEVIVLGEQELDQLAVGTWGDDDGDIIPFFTSEAMVQASAQALPGIEPSIFSLPCRDLWQFTAGSRLVLNPHGPVARVYEPAEVAALLAGVEPGPYPVSYEDLGLEVSVPSPEPAALLEALRGLLSPRPQVSAAHLAWVKRSDGTEGYLLFVLTGDPERAFEGIEELDLDRLLGGHSLDVTAVPSHVDDHLLADIEPFLRR